METKLSEYVKVAEAAEILGVSQGTLRNWSEAGKIPMHKNPVNGYKLFKKSELDEFLDAIERTLVLAKIKRPNRCCLNGLRFQKSPKS